MAQRADAVADLVLTTFRNLPAKFKPRSMERREWVPIAGIVLSKGHLQPPGPSSPTQRAECIALATGMKCHPHTKLPHLNGHGLHDSHAEILALRAFNRFLLRECADLAARGLTQESKWLRWKRDSERWSGEATSSPQPFALHDDVAIHMYCSEAPCGDASMEIIMAKQGDDTPWSASPRSSSHTPVESSNGAPMHGRGHFDLLGAVRRKPSRPDAPLTLSKSCTDKLALKQCTGLLSAVTAELIWPGNVYLTDVTIPASQYVPEAWERAFGAGGRMAKLNDGVLQARWKRKGFQFTPFKVMTTDREFEYSKRHLSQQNQDDLEPVPSNRCCVYIAPNCSEVLINGVLEGRKWDEARGASELSRRKMWQAAAGIARVLDVPNLKTECTYGELKRSEALDGREEVKADVRELVLLGWRRNDGDDEWSLSEEELRGVDGL